MSRKTKTEKPDRWTFTSSSDGYSIFLDGKFQRGAIRDPRVPHNQTCAAGTPLRRRPWQHVRADAKNNYTYAKTECDRLNAEARTA